MSQFAQPLVVNNPAQFVVPIVFHPPTPRPNVQSSAMRRSRNSTGDSERKRVRATELDGFDAYSPQYNAVVPPPSQQSTTAATTHIHSNEGGADVADRIMRFLNVEITRVVDILEGLKKNVRSLEERWVIAEQERADKAHKEQREAHHSTKSPAELLAEVVKPALSTMQREIKSEMDEVKEEIRRVKRAVEAIPATPAAVSSSGTGGGLGTLSTSTFPTTTQTSGGGSWGTSFGSTIDTATSKKAEADPVITVVPSAFSFGATDKAPEKTGGFSFGGGTSALTPKAPDTVPATPISATGGGFSGFGIPAAPTSAAGGGGGTPASTGGFGVTFTNANTTTSFTAAPPPKATVEATAPGVGSGGGVFSGGASWGSSSVVANSKSDAAPPPPGGNVGGFGGSMSGSSFTFGGAPQAPQQAGAKKPPFSFGGAGTTAVQMPPSDQAPQFGGSGTNSGGFSMGPKKKFNVVRKR